MQSGGLFIVEKARIFATAGHAAAGNLRRYTGEPYIVHPAEVVDILRQHTDCPITLAAGWMHDLFEDTKVPRELVLQEFGSEIFAVVDELTDQATADHGPRAARKAFDRARMANASSRAQLVRIADILSNCRSIAHHDPKFAATYLQEKRAMLQVLGKAHGELHTRATRMLERFIA